MYPSHVNLSLLLFFFQGEGAQGASFFFALVFLLLVTCGVYVLVRRNNRELLDLQPLYMRALLKVYETGTGSAKDVRLSHHDVQRRLAADINADNKSDKTQQAQPQQQQQSNDDGDHKDDHDDDEKPKRQQQQQKVPTSPWQIKPVKRDQRIVVTQQLKILIS